ncbi:hypothetical protein AS159_06910 [Thermotoga sp. Ku-13t]|uniref:hypothetical protein n=1 Tax=Thermotoga sp. Ku-13t TaxID=1755813 RepID=UPI0013ED142A|nr:hypothetical protein [Thermotoga sp. Ku-13t]KAF2957403.1 hypothetical protein AS159_06910 [Thermotoga sp. Ku-13t]
MKGKSWLFLCLVTVASVLLSSCAFNLFANSELRDLLMQGTTEQRLQAASNALSGSNYDAAIALAASVMNELLGLNLTNEQLERLLDSTSTVYEITQAFEDATATNELVNALKILVEAVARKTNKDVTSLAEEIFEIFQELGIDLGLSKSVSKQNTDFWDVLETHAGTLVAQLANTFNTRHVLKLLTSGYYFITKNSTDNTLSVALCIFYDTGYMFNLLIDVNDDGEITDEQFVKDVMSDPASIVGFSQEATSGLYKDFEDCYEFVWAYDVLKEMLDVLSIEATFATLDATSLSQEKNIYGVFTLLFGE